MNSGMKHVAMLVLVALGSACTANPQPVPLPIDSQAVYLSGSKEDSDQAFLAGQPGAVPEGSSSMEVVVENVQRQTRYRSGVGEDGSFLVEVALMGSEQLLMWVELAGQVGPPVGVRTMDIMPPNLPVLTLSVQSVSLVVGGQVEIEGSSTGDVVLVGNPRQNASQAARPAGLGAWSVTIEAAVGDELVAFAVEEGFLIATEPTFIPVN